MLLEFKSVKDETVCENNISIVRNVAKLELNVWKL